VRFTLVILILSAAAGSATADPAGIPLPGLAGDYAYAGLGSGDPNSRQMVFRFPAEVEDFSGLKMRLVGLWEQHGTYEVVRQVGGIAYRDTLPFLAGIQLTLTTEEMGGDVFWGREPQPWGAMDGWEQELVFCCPNRPLQAGDAALLLGRTVTAELTLVGVPDPEQVVEDAWGRLDEVSLVLDGAVPVDSEPWGAVKALYR
jgi:hypothetical protein